MSAVTLETPELFVRLVVETSMPKRLKIFILNILKTALVFSVVLTVFDQIGPMIAGEYFTLIWWGIDVVSLAIIAFIIWRLCVGLQNGYLLFDDLDD